MELVPPRSLGGAFSIQMLFGWAATVVAPVAMSTFVGGAGDEGAGVLVGELLLEGVGLGLGELLAVHLVRERLADRLLDRFVDVDLRLPEVDRKVLHESDARRR